VELISDIGDTIRQVRSSIYELGSTTGDPGVRADVLALTRSLSPIVGFDIRVSFDGPIDAVISEVVTEHLLATIREAVTNVGRLAHATEASVTIGVEQVVCRLEVTDNGSGLQADGAAAGGLGLVNLRHRAESLDGLMSIESPETGGTRLIWQVPVSQ
jgi:signal transduction histidine kinase